MPDKEVIVATVTAKCRLCEEVVHNETFTSDQVTNAGFWASSDKCLTAMQKHFDEKHVFSNIFIIK